MPPLQVSRPSLRPENTARPTRQGFTLVVTLVILAAVTILVVGLYGIVSRETQTSASYDAVDQADLAMQSGLDRVGILLKGALADELGVVFSVPLSPAVDDKNRPREMLMAANYDAVAKQWKYQPLASGIPVPANSQKLAMPASGFEKIPVKDPMVGPSVEENAVEARKLPTAAPWAARTPRYWMQVRLPGEEAAAGGQEGEQGSQTPKEGDVVARYSFYVEDLQGKLNLANAGEHDSAKNIPFRQPEIEKAEVATAPVFGVAPIVPGMKIEPNGRWRRNPSSVWTLLRPDLEPLNSAAIPQSMNAMHQRLTSINAKRLSFSPEMWRELLVSPDPLTNWTGIDAARLSGPNARLANGSLADGQLRALEENTTGYLTPYDELALVPYGPEFKNGGGRKMNINRILYETGGDTGMSDQTKLVERIDEMAEHINSHLPQFSKRAGGYPLPRSEGITNRAKHKMAYLKCLAAGMLDYADMDPMPSINQTFGGAGSESTESNIEYRGTDSFPIVNEYWQRYRMEEFASRSVKYSLTDFVELWNPTNQVIKGQITCCFEYKGRMVAGFRSYQVMSSLHLAESSGKPASQNGLAGYWFAPREILLQPNELQVIKFDPVKFTLDGGELGNVVGVDYFGQPANGNDDRESRYRLAFKMDGATQFSVVDMPLAPVERYYKNANLTNRQLFNVSQPGMAYRLRQQGFAWNVGDSRASYFIDYNQEEISYTGGSSPWGRNYRRLAIDLLPGESRPNFWPDGGHNTVPCPTSIGDTARNPDDISLRPTVNPTNSAAERQKFVQRISNAGRFYSPTEMGNVFDPIMWDPNGGGWFDEKVLYSDHADLKPAVVKIDSETELDAHKRFCGGNSLRIGRVEHSIFRPDYRSKPDAGRPTDRGMAASALLDLFHCGDANSQDPERIRGPLVRIDGHVNVNTASRDTLRALVAGRLVMDPRLRHDSNDSEPDGSKPTLLLAPSKKRVEAQADVIASAIIENRPYITPAEVAEKAVLSPADAALMEKNSELPLLEASVPVFGYTKRDPSDDLRVRPEWSDAAAEELFSRLWNNSTVRSRHFQVVVCGQAVKIGRDGETHVVSTRSRLYHLFVKPVRAADGTLQGQVVEITYSRPL